MKRGVAQIFLIVLVLVVPLVAAMFVFFSQGDRQNKEVEAEYDPKRIAVGGVNYYLLGVNYPWNRWGADFGGSSGVHTGYSEGDFVDMKNKGVHIVRWNVFEGHNGIVYNSGGTPTGLDNNVFADLDKAVLLARQNNIYLNLVLTDFGFFNKSGGHSDVFKDSVKMTAFINNVVDPIVSRYANEPYILSWEAMNEPEWGLSDIPQPAVNSSLDAVTMSQFSSFASQFSNVVHSKSKSLFTVGSAALKWNKIWTNSFADSKGLPRLNLDFYQTHYYPWMDCCTTDDAVLGRTTWSPMTQNALALGLDKPIVVGEVPDSNSNRDKVFANGYAGYWAWSYKYMNTGDKIQVDWGTFTPWEANNASLVRIPAPGVPPSPAPTSQPALTTPTPSPVATSLPSPTPTPLPKASNKFVGQYFNTINFTRLRATRDDLKINFDWGTARPLPSVGEETFSVRWVGDFDFAAGTYKFTSTTDDGMRIWIDNVLVLDKWINQAPTTYTVNKSMTAGVHIIKVEYFENSGRAIAKVDWVKQ